MKLSDLTDGTRIALGNVADYASDFVAPSLRLGVTGLSRAGKTVFITSLVHNLIHNGRLPLFVPHARGRIKRAYLEPQPDDDLPRFAYEQHLKDLTGENRSWPQSTRSLSQLRVTVEYTPQGFFARNIHGGKLHIDIIDYPGEWLLDLPLLQQTYEQWSNNALATSTRPPRDRLAKDWRQFTQNLKPSEPAQESDAVQAAKLFTNYLGRCRDDEFALSTLPPGRFLMPGDLEGSPLLTFAPLELDPGTSPESGSLHAMMQRRYDAYIDHIVRPFYVNHFARLDRQIVLVDTMAALNAGPESIADLKNALGDILASFRQGENSILSSIFAKRIDKVLFAATKADMLHHTTHDRLENILSLIIEDAAKRADLAGARYDVTAIAALRATRETTIEHNGESLACITGIPAAGEVIGGQTFDGKTQAAVFPGDLPADPAAALDGSLKDSLHFVRFRPPLLEPAKPLQPAPALPHIRLDRAMQFLLGDYFQ
ncbi:MAG TPA: YcjX family protein [Rhizobiales bacterium]|nr:YcjX family protein [Hyphomicrobiales bacterium]